MQSGSVLDIFTKIVGSYNLLLIVVSLILNPIVFFMCLKSKNLRSTSTFKLLAFGSINDLFVCVAWNLEAFAVSFFNYVAYYRSLFFCKWITLFIQLTSLEIEVWLLVGISFDRLLSLSVKKWSSHYFNGIKPIIYSVIMIVVMASVNFCFLFVGGYSYVSNGTEIIACFETPPDYNLDWFNIMQNVTIFFGFLTPSTILVLVNFIIIYKATRFERNNRILVVNVSKTPTAILEARGAKRKQEMTKTILIITFLFVVVSFPSFLVNCFFLFQVLSLEYGQLIMNLVCAIQYSYPAFNFFILYFSNKRFSHEVKNTIRSFHVSSNSVQTTQRT